MKLTNKELINIMEDFIGEALSYEMEEYAKKLIRKCKRCEKPFIVKSIRTYKKWCSSNCRIYNSVEQKVKKEM
jgi:hypothetical protein